MLLCSYGLTKHSNSQSNDNVTTKTTVIGPAGVGKTSYCQTMQEHGDPYTPDLVIALLASFTNLFSIALVIFKTGRASKRTIHVANLDPAAEHYQYEAEFDVRDLISLEEVTFVWLYLNI